MLEHTIVQLGASLAPADLCQVSGAQGLIVCVHPHGGANTSRRLQSVLLRLQARGFSTLDLDLLAPEEADDAERLNDSELLAQRLDHALDLLPTSVRDLPLLLFGSDSGAAAMLRSAACRPRGIRALVSRSGRLDLASDVLGDVRLPTLLVVAAGDPEIVEINRQAFTRMRCEKRIDVVPRATHHFLEAGTLDVVAQLASDWFTGHLAPAG
ncbi:alpha/beta hydrolase [Piscinibacter gummiphilus]|uniref:Alpha/beta hydrolase n=1 Tax=Piscinibacter gummiphilus TaxID=946333 RepID=A0ABZ0CLW8_9BURK|nr:alpha/beta hydrolase [Piscinibacter gummiphilus]WOB05960.1 alpha/beta hydrolase [Piscinibacter gummiphilus]